MNLAAREKVYGLWTVRRRHETSVLPFATRPPHICAPFLQHRGFRKPYGSDIEVRCFLFATGLVKIWPALSNGRGMDREASA
jgi:hypothetical protein